jgi:hypothetical protein
MGVRDELAKAITKGIRAFHSSPHDFERFDISKIGTGEGAQMYGHGLYFAENPAVSGQGGQYWDQFKRRFDRHTQDAADVLREHGFDRQEAAASIAAQIDAVKARLATAGPNANFEGMQAALRNWQAQHDLIAGGGPVGPRTYEVNIKADPATMLDWDKPLAAQPDIYRKLDISGAAGPVRRLIDEYGLDTITGGKAYQQLAAGRSSSFSSDPMPRGWAASRVLEREGIPGIKYLDEGSRISSPAQIKAIQDNIAQRQALLAANPDNPTDLKWLNEYQDMLKRATNPTSNYVVFDPANVDILKKYGVAAAPIGALGATFDPSQYEAAP